MTNPAARHPKVARVHPADSARRRGKRREKFLSAKIPCNPLISLDLGRENPRKSKLFQPSKTGVFAAKRLGAKKIQTQLIGSRARPYERRASQRPANSVS